MSETANNDSSTELEKPGQDDCDVQFPPFPEPTDEDFEEDVPEEEKKFYKNKFPDLNLIKNARLHCTACDRHLGCSARNESRMRSHPMLRTLVCNTCHSFYNSGEFDKGEDGSELYCRWCGQGGQVYCCSDCPHVFCAKCIKRNLGPSKIKEIEDIDDWKCFKCNPKCLWDHRAICWALLRYCDVKNKIAYKTQDPVLKEKYQKDCGTDHTECCKNKRKRKEKSDAKKTEADKKTEPDKKTRLPIISKLPQLPPSIQVKKFASINLTESPKIEKKAQKRPASPKKIFMKTPVPIAPNVKIFGSTPAPPPLKKFMKIQNAPVINPVRYQKDKSAHFATYSRVQPRLPHPQMPTTFSILNNQLNNQFNGFNNMPNTNMLYNSVTDNINLSLENLTQGLDMAAFRNNVRDELVCTPDFPIEPICEVTEDHTDDDVQCMTPGPVNNNTPPPLVPRVSNKLPDITSENIIQMTENDVTVNPTTGGLKFRVDPQTLSSNKMYRLPDGRVFAINANPNMPGGYSATIVAFAENSSAKLTPKAKGPTFAAKLSAVIPPSAIMETPKTKSPNENRVVSKRKPVKETQSGDRAPRECDLKVPVEFYRYNLIDAVDALEYSLSRLQKLKNQATTMYLRSRTLNEMRTLHRNLDRLLNTSCTRFNEIKLNLNKEMKQYVMQKMDRNVSNQISEEEDDDDVEILNDVTEDPISIDENSMDSNVNDTQEVDLTVASSEHNESEERSINQNDSNEQEKNFTPSDNEKYPQRNNNKSDRISEVKARTGNEMENKDKAENQDLTSNDVESVENDEHLINKNDEETVKNDEHSINKNDVETIENDEHSINKNDVETGENDEHSINKTKSGSSYKDIEDNEDSLITPEELNCNEDLEKITQSIREDQTEAGESEVNGKSDKFDFDAIETNHEEKSEENPDTSENKREEMDTSQIDDIRSHDVEGMIDDLLNENNDVRDSQNSMMDISEELQET